MMRGAVNPAIRAAVAARIEALIELLDMLDGDCELEISADDEDHDYLSEDAFKPEWLKDGGDPVFGIMPTLPVYGVDQSQGPVNENEAYRDWQRQLLAA